MLTIYCLCLGLQNNKEIAFVHIPKTGGETVEKLFGLSKNHHPVYKRFSKGIPDNAFVFSIIRDPYTRIFSWFKFCIHGWNKILPHPRDVCREAHLRFMKANTTRVLRKGFMEWLSKIDTHKYYMAGPMFLSSYEYLKYNDGATPVIQNLIRFEHFSHDLNRILKG